MILYELTVAQNESDLLDELTTQKHAPFDFEPKSHILLIFTICPLSSSDSQIGTYNEPGYKCQPRWHKIWDTSCFYEEILDLPSA